MVVDSLTHQLTVSTYTRENLSVCVCVHVDVYRSSSNNDDIGGSCSGSFLLYIYRGYENAFHEGEREEENAKSKLLCQLSNSVQ